MTPTRSLSEHDDAKIRRVDTPQPDPQREARVKGLTIRVGSTWGSEPLAVALARTDFSGVTRLNECGSKRGVKPFIAAVAGWLAAVALSFVFGLVRLRTEEDPEPADPVVLAYLAGWSSIGYASYYLARWCFPRIELLPAGQPSRWLRVRKFVLGALLFVAAAAAGVLTDSVIRPSRRTDRGAADDENSVIAPSGVRGTLLSGIERFKEDGEMAHWVHVVVRGSSDTIDGPPGAQEEAERQLGVIRDTLGTSRKPELPWLAVMGKDILSARVMNNENIGIA